MTARTSLFALFTALVACGALAACGTPPPLHIEYTLTDEPSQLCYSDPATQTVASSCMDVSMLCAADLSVRVFSPSASSTPYISLCAPVTESSLMNLCSIAGIDLPPPVDPIPEETLEVDVAVYRDSDLMHDANNNPICPTDIIYAPDGLPEDGQPTNGEASPAIGGRAFYHSGDANTVVALGCTNQGRLQNLSCIGADTVDVTATVDDFNNDLPVSPSLGSALSVFFGEPQSSGSAYTLDPAEEKLLPQTVTQPIPGWGAVVQIDLVATACLEVLEDVAETTPTLVCEPVTQGQQEVDLVGVRLAKTTLDEILSALDMNEFPDAGLVVGMVLDDLGNPAAGAVVTPTSSSGTGTIQYLSADGLMFTSGSAAVTSTNGIFVSLDAPYGTIFTVPASVQTAPPPELGGLVQGKVTIVVLQFKQPSST
jgi:hypothetical protein